MPSVQAERLRAWLEHLEAALAEVVSEEALASLAYVAGREARLDERELAAALRRSLLIHAAGGDLRRELVLDDPAVASLAADLIEPAADDRLSAGLATLARQALQLERVLGALALLQADPTLRWRAFASSLLAEELGEHDEEP